ncbi:hypothetical protein RvY_09125 [Ramazzottius varieornatus]|uniref:BTB domain-containing protein n=1 Tax=Ramazzottius varieornatus TaxID=947166 RepID=A0A1D1VCV0_RAMVA|nr:hypothetical protein RvY_09125 [Ramazzottius varieornatus]
MEQLALLSVPNKVPSSRRSSLSVRRKSSLCPEISLLGSSHYSHVEIISCNTFDSDIHVEICQLFATLNTLWESEDPCDVAIVVGQTTVDAHKKVLSHFSPYFRAMFEARMAESQQDIIELHDVDATAVEDVIGFAYSGKLTLRQDNVQQITETGSMFQLGLILIECCRYLRNELDPANCLGIAQFADTYNLATMDLPNLARNFARVHFSELTHCEEFLELDTTQLVDLLSSPYLSCDNEEQVYEMCVNWLLYEPADRVLHVPEVLDKVHLCLMKLEYLSALTESVEPHASPFKEIRSYLLDQLDRWPGNCPCNNGPLKYCHRRRHLQENLCILGGLTPTGSRELEMDKYNPATREWTEFDKMLGRKTGVGAAEMDDFLYVAGGSDPKIVYRTVQKYSPRPEVPVWLTDVASMISSRAYFCLVKAINGFLYAIGGWNNDGECLKSVERYDPIRNRWSSTTPMSSKRSGAGCAAMMDHIYVCGGNDGIFTLNSVERLNLDSHVWEPVPPMQEKRCDLGCAVLNNFLYAVGGSKQDHASCERLNIRSQVWEVISPMTSLRPHGSIGAKFIKNILYVVGGSDRNVPNELEAYNPETDSWTPQPSMKNPSRIQGGYVVLTL